MPITRAVTSATRALPTAAAAALLAAVEDCERLPVLDVALQRVLDLADRGDAGTSELTAAIERDPGLAASLLRYVNSAALARVVPARSVRQAVTLVGRRGVRRLALEAVVFRFLERVGGTGPSSLGRLHVHAVRVGALAAETARLAGVGADRPHLAGLLHDCGRLVMPLAFDPDELERLAAKHPDGGALARAERRALGADHAHAGALLAAACGLDREVIAAIALHHGGDHGLQTPDPVTACVQVAETLASLAASGHGDLALLDGALALLGLPADAPDQLLAGLLGAQGGGTGTVPAPGGGDDVTGLPARRAWVAGLRERLVAGEPGCVVLCELQGVEAVARAHGAPMAERALAEAAEVAARHGAAGRLGPEHLVLWVGGDPGQGREAARRVVAELGAALGAGLGVTARAGLAAAAGTPQRAEALLDAAHRDLGGPHT